MKINPIMNPNITRSYQANSTRSLTSPQSPKAGRDEVTFSAEALSFQKSLQEARESVEARTPEDMNRIDAIRTAVQNGTYSVSSEDIADRILSSVLGAR
ncbi:MAG: flagellar biosynthesis anti-sigma factor FlgM [Oscillospiraceae bacterium]|nr:flagellar biosynthesis anti-sigma factor FlgM [Oscillospiraceae bacterium]